MHMVRHLGGLFLAVPAWRVLLGIYAAIFAYATGAKLIRPKPKRRGGGAAGAKPEAARRKKQTPSFRRQFVVLLGIAMPSWRSGPALRLYR